MRLGQRRQPRGRNAQEIAGISEIPRLRGIGLILSFCRAFPAPTVNQACLKIVVSPVRVRVSPTRNLDESVFSFFSEWLLDGVDWWLLDDVDWVPDRVSATRRNSC